MNGVAHHQLSHMAAMYVVNDHWNDICVVFDVAKVGTGLSRVDVIDSHHTTYQYVYSRVIGQFLADHWPWRKVSRGVGSFGCRYVVASRHGDYL